MYHYLTHFKWVMLISGILTCTMFTGLFAPDSAVISNFGEPVEGAAAGLIVRNWSALIGLMGVMLIYGAFNATVRRYSLIIAGTSKLVFIILVLMYGGGFMKFGVGTAVVVDSIMLVLFATYLLFAAGRSEKVKVR